MRSTSQLRQRVRARLLIFVAQFLVSSWSPSNFFQYSWSMTSLDSTKKRTISFKNCVSISGKLLNAYSRLILLSALTYLDLFNKVFSMLIALPNICFSSGFLSSQNTSQINCVFGRKVLLEKPHQYLAQCNAETQISLGIYTVSTQQRKLSTGSTFSLTQLLI